MTTYRTGNHWGVTIVREPTDGEQWVCSACGYHNLGGICTHCGNRPGQLVAVVVNGDQELAERICALLNAAEGNPRGYHPTCIETTGHAELIAGTRSFICGQDCPTPHKPDPADAHTPDVDHLRGAAEALAEVRRRLDRWSKLFPDHDNRPAIATVYGMLRDAAAELGVSEDAPSGPRIQPQSDQNGPTVGRDTPEAPEGSQGVEIVHLVRDDHGTTRCCYRTPFELPTTERITYDPDAVTCGMVPR